MKGDRENLMARGARGFHRGTGAVFTGGTDGGGERTTRVGTGKRGKEREVDR